jgi:hypothetical protein
MFIRAVDEGLERYIRAELPLPPDLGDVSFDPPTGTWSAQLSRLTVNFFLYDVSRSSQPSRSPVHRVVPNGVAQRRVSLPMVQLGYVVSAWAGSPRDEHQLLGDVFDRLAGLTTLPPTYLPAPVSSSIDFGVVDDTANRARELWSALGGQLKASFTVRATLAADAFEWEDAPPPVARIEALTVPKSSVLEIPAGQPGRG